MDRLRWLITIGIALTPMLAGMALQQPADKSRPNVGGPQAKVTNPHGPISTPCQNCHTYTSWKPVRSNPEFNHDQTGYPLRGMHEKVGCTKCHTSLVFKNVSSQCADCHADFHRGQFGSNCASCHTVKGWNVSRDAIKNHQNRFPLVGAHALVECDQCHKGAASGQFTGLSTACYSCHQKDFQTPVIDHVTAGFPTTCESCHTMDSWFGAKFDHLKYTGYALTGMHATLACTQCHVGNVYKGTPADCYSCHTTDFTNTNNPSHVQLGMPHDCGLCHSTTNWLNATFDHSITSFPLTGAHITVTCAQCHTNNNYSGGLPTACYGCHKADFTGAASPPHVSAGFPTDCTVCHNTVNWTSSTFNHNSVFPLTGFHATMPCAQCHTNNNYTTLAKTCVGCHQADFNGTKNPPHVSGGFPTTCDTCHNTTSWTNATFDHNNTTFPLTGAHASVQCALCHTSNNYTGNLPTDCYSCHTKDFNATANPAHVAGGFPTNCTLCHTTANWTTSTFNHASVFPLTGFHATMPCAQCHTNNNYTTLPTACFGCHQADWNGTKAPPHAASGFPTTCDTCHSTTDWTGASFNHSTTSFPLTGAHTSVTCAQCHTNNNYLTLPTTCVGCHQADFNGTANPAHVASGFPTDCTLCHSTANWTTSTFNHASVFPLTGFHATMPCAQCHTNNNYTTLPTLCYGCHQADWNGTQNPPHASTGFPTTCDTCHSTTDWTGATFNHNNTPFPLTGYHANAAVTCVMCHINNVYVGTPTDCYSCHTKDFTGTTNPNHTSAGWPTTCVTCHTTTAWIPATLPKSYHTFFPTNHGNANSVCTTCHANSADYSVFSCTTGCHGNNNAANFHHPNTNGYVYNSVNCYACHKSGGGG